MIDNTSCLNAVNTIKGHISDCYSECTAKGSTFSGTKKLSNLKKAISLIPTEGGTVSEGVTGGSFNLFTKKSAHQIKGIRRYFTFCL